MLLSTLKCILRIYACHALNHNFKYDCILLIFNFNSHEKHYIYKTTRYVVYRKKK